MHFYWDPKYCFFLTVYLKLFAEPVLFVVDRICLLKKKPDPDPEKTRYGSFLIETNLALYKRLNSSIYITLNVYKKISFLFLVKYKVVLGRQQKKVRILNAVLIFVT